MLVPLVCPVCHGRQRVPAGFYGYPTDGCSTLEEVCRSCHGLGYILVEQPEEKNRQENRPNRFWEIKYSTIMTNSDSTADWF